MPAWPHRLDDTDGIYIKVQGRWCYLYRAIDRSGALVDVLFSERSVNPGEEGKSDDQLFAQSIDRARKEGSAAIVFFLVLVRAPAFLRCPVSRRPSR